MALTTKTTPAPGMTPNGQASPVTKPRGAKKQKKRLAIILFPLAILYGIYCAVLTYVVLHWVYLYVATTPNSTVSTVNKSLAFTNIEEVIRLKPLFLSSLSLNVVNVFLLLILLLYCVGLALAVVFLEYYMNYVHPFIFIVTGTIGATLLTLPAFFGLFVICNMLHLLLPYHLLFIVDVVWEVTSLLSISFYLVTFLSVRPKQD